MSNNTKKINKNITDCEILFKEIKNDIFDDILNEKMQLLFELHFQIGKKFIKHILKDIDYEIDKPHFYLLFYIYKKEPLTVSKIAKKLDISLSAVTNLTNKLVKNEFVERKYNPSDRRVVMIKITDKGDELLKRIESFQSDLFRQLYNHFGEEKIKMLISQNMEFLEWIFSYMENKVDGSEENCYE